MYRRLILVALLASVVASTAVLAQPRPAQARSYTVPRTEHGHPDFQGIWVTAFLTMLERLPGVEGLVATPEQAKQLAAAITLLIEAPELRSKLTEGGSKLISDWTLRNQADRTISAWQTVFDSVANRHGEKAFAA